VALTGTASDGVDGRRRRRSGTHGSAATYARRWRRGEAAGSRITRWRKRGERGRLGMKTRRRSALTRVEAAKAMAHGALGRGAIRTAPLRHGVGTGTWQPCGYGLLMSGPGAERERLIGGTPWQQFSELKTLPDENSSKQIARS
jgi:hypothetical protein